MKKIAVTGATGNLGRELVNLGAIPILGDITKVDEIRESIRSVSPDVLIHCAGISNLEEVHKDFDKAMEVNLMGAANVIDQWAFPHTRFIYISSSHIFDGRSKKPYQEKDLPNPKRPMSDYAMLKVSTEAIARADGATIVRLSTMFNETCWEIKDWKTFYEHGDDIEVPIFFKRTYAYISHIAEGLMNVANRIEIMPKVLNVSGTQNLSMYEFALAVAAHYGWNKNAFYPRKAEVVSPIHYEPRPHNGGLDTRLAAKYKVPLYSALQGIELLK